VTVGASDTVQEVAAKMKEHNIGFVPVVEGKKLVGAITDRDLAIRGYAENVSGSTPIKNLISQNLTTATPDTSIDDAAKLMAREQVRRLPVVENGELIGVLAIGDLAVRDKFDDEAGEALSKISEQS
jgi:CBS domain-containing protein